MASKVAHWKPKEKTPYGSFFRFLIGTNLVTAAFLIGALALLVAIIGKIKTIIEPTPLMRIVLAMFGLLLIVMSLGAYTADNRSTVATAQNIDSSQTAPCLGKCWQYDDNAHTMTWVGPADGVEDIWQGDNESLNKIRSGYAAIFRTIVPGAIVETCILELDGQALSNSCSNFTVRYPVSTGGMHRVISSNARTGGFRWSPDPGYGWRK